MTSKKFLSPLGRGSNKTPINTGSLEMAFSARGPPNLYNRTYIIEEFDYNWLANCNINHFGQVRR